AHRVTTATAQRQSVDNMAATPHEMFHRWWKHGKLHGAVCLSNSARYPPTLQMPVANFSRVSLLPNRHARQGRCTACHHSPEWR
ncbi:MAG TPA: hypothetical protein PKA06_09815, partial [Gemmatales bacterium]|nr:hypothetical protein [Gemmatales bacterium]